MNKESDKSKTAAAPRLRRKYRETYRQYQAQIENTLGDMPEPARTKERRKMIKDVQRFTQRTTFSAEEYFRYGFYGKSEEERMTYLPIAASFIFGERMNAHLDAVNTRSKMNVYYMLRPYFHREMRIFTEELECEQFYAYLKEAGALFIKPSCGSRGRGSRLIKYEDVQDKETEYREMIRTYGDDGFVAEELVRQSGFMMELNPTSVNTLRVFTFRLADRVCTYSFLRVGRKGSIVDNAAAGGISCGIDQESGIIINAADGTCRSYTQHPDSGVQIVGQKIPRFREGIELAKEIAVSVPAKRYFGIDLALTDEGWVLVEMNAKATYYSVQQLYKRGIRKDVEGYLAELGMPAELSAIRPKNKGAERL